MGHAAATGSQCMQFVCLLRRYILIFFTSSQLVAIHASPGVAHGLSQCVNATGYSIVCLRMWCCPASLQPTPWCRLHKSKAQCDDALYSPTTPLYDDVYHFKLYGCMNPPQGLTLLPAVSGCVARTAMPRQLREVESRTCRGQR